MFLYSFSTIYSSHRRRNLQFYISITILLLGIVSRIQSVTGGVIKRETIKSTNNNINETTEADITELGNVTTLKTTPAILDVTEAINVKSTSVFNSRPTVKTKQTTIVTNDIQVTPTIIEPTKLDVEDDHIAESLEKVELRKIPKTTANVRQSDENLVDITTTTTTTTTTQTPRRNFRATPKESTTTTESSSLESTKSTPTTQSQSQVEVNQIEQQLFKVTTSKSHQVTTPAIEVEDTTIDDSLHFDINEYINHQNPATTERLNTHDKLAEDRFHSTDYEKHFNELKLTTPASYYDFETSSSNNTINDDNNVFDKIKKTDFTKNNEKLQFDDIKANSTIETNTTILVDQSEIESTNYDIATNEIKNFTYDKNPHLVFSEIKSNKFNETKLEIHPLRTKLDSHIDIVSNIDNTKDASGTFVNKTSEINEPHSSVTTRTRQESSWIGKSLDSDSVRHSNNDSFSATLSPNSIENALETDKVPKIRDKHKSEQLLQENKVIPVVVAAPTTPNSDENIINESELTSTVSNNVDESTSLIEKGNKLEDVEVFDITTKRDYDKLGKYIEPTSDSNNITEVKNLVETTTKQKISEQETTETTESKTNLEVTTQSLGISHSSRDETYTTETTTTIKPTTLLFPSIYAKTSDEITSIYKGDWPSTTIFSARKPKTTEGKPKTIELPSETSTGKNLDDTKTTEFDEKISETTIKEEVNGTNIISAITDDGTTISAILESTTKNIVGEESAVGSLAPSEVETTENISTLKTTDKSSTKDTTTDTEISDTTVNSTERETTSKTDSTVNSTERETTSQTDTTTDDGTDESTVKGTTTETDLEQSTFGAHDNEETTAVESLTKYNTNVDETTFSIPQTSTFRGKTERTIFKTTSDLATTTEVEESTPTEKENEKTTLKQKEDSTTLLSFNEKIESETEEIDETTLNIKKTTVTEKDDLDGATVTTPENLFETTTLQIVHISVKISSDPSETTTDSQVDNTTVTSPSEAENEIRKTEKSTKLDTTTEVPDFGVSTEETKLTQSTTESVITFESYTAQSVDRQTTLATTEQTISEATRITPVATTEEPSTTSTIEQETTTESTDDSSIEANVIDRTSTSSPEPTHSTSSTTESSMATVVTRITTEFTRNRSDEQAITPYSTTTETNDIVPIKDVISSTSNSELQNIETTPPEETDMNVIIAVSVSVVAIIILVVLAVFFYVMRKRQKQITYGQRCRPVSLDAYSLDNVSVFNSVRRKGALRASKRTYGNAAFDDPSLKHNVLTAQALGKFLENKTVIREEFSDVPQVIARADEVPPGCEDKNRYANVIPLPETRVILEQQNGDEKTEYINANFVRGPKDEPNYYIACQAPLESTVGDFWRMIWEQNSRVIIMATDLIENGIEKCAEYLPASMTLDDHTVYGDFQITLKNREVKEKYAVSTLHVKNMLSNTWRELTHFWYQWPENGVPGDESSVIAMLLEARTYLKSSMPDQNENDENKSEEKHKNGKITSDTNGTTDKPKVTTTSSKTQGPLTVHCSPGTGRTGTIIACDIAIRCLELPKRSVDIPQIVYFVRRGRASSVQTKEQYEFIYRVANAYATKLMGPINDN